jgi:hypothetical protein
MRNGYQRLPLEVVQFWYAVENVPRTPEAEIVYTVCMDVMRKTAEEPPGFNPRKEFNLRLTRRRQRSSHLYWRFLEWLIRGEVSRAARKGGSYWAYRKWFDATWRLIKGAKPHAAFDMDKPGRRRQHTYPIVTTYRQSLPGRGSADVTVRSPSGFRLYQDAGILFEYYKKIEKRTSKAALAAVADDFAPVIDGLVETEVRRGSKSVAAKSYRDVDLICEADLIRWKAQNSAYDQKK